MIESAFVAVSLPPGIDQRQIARLVDSGDRLITLREIERLDRQGDFFGEADPDKTAGGNRVTVSYETRRFLCADNLSTVQPFNWRKLYSICVNRHESLLELPG